MEELIVDNTDIYNAIAIFAYPGLLIMICFLLKYIWGNINKRIDSIDGEDGKFVKIENKMSILKDIEMVKIEDKIITLKDETIKECRISRNELYNTQRDNYVSKEVYETNQGNTNKQMEYMTSLVQGLDTRMDNFMNWVKDYLLNKDK